MSRSTRDRIKDIRTSIAAIREFARAGRGSPMAFDAVRMRLLEMGEAANGIPAELRGTEPAVPWGEITLFRHRARLRLGDRGP